VVVEGKEKFGGGVKGKVTKQKSEGQIALS
jgi:hypothetical protein